jgi:hypothetical protein
MTTILDSFITPRKIISQKIKVGDYFYCDFPESFGQPVIGWLKISFVEANGFGVYLKFSEKLLCPMVLEKNKEYLVK